jgi:hypothetical protein
MRSTWTRLAVVAVLMLILIGCGAGSTGHTADWSTVQASLTTTSAKLYRSEREYKSECGRIDFRDFQEDPNAYEGQDNYLKGTVTGIQQSTSMVSGAFEAEILGPTADRPLANCAVARIR